MLRVGSAPCCACAAIPRSKANGSPRTVDFQNRFTGIVTLPWSYLLYCGYFIVFVVSCLSRRECCLVAQSAAACMQATAAVHLQNLSIRQREHPERRAPIRVAQLWRQRCERARLARAVTGRNRDVLLAVHRVRDRERVDGVVEPHLPQHLASRVVERPEVAIPGAAEH